MGRSSFYASRRNGLVFIAKYNKEGNLIYNKTYKNADGSNYIDYVSMDVFLNTNDTLSLFIQTNKNNNDSSVFNFYSIDMTFFKNQ